jgi:chromate transporter
MRGIMRLDGAPACTRAWTMSCETSTDAAQAAAELQVATPAVAPAPSLPALFFAFLRLGATAFGGPAMVAYIKDLAVAKRRWLDESTFRNGVALCQTVPGATAMQTAAYVGLRSRGFLGGLAAYVGFGFPAFCLMLALTAVYRQTQSLPIAVALFHGLRAIVVALIANAAWTFARNSVRRWQAAVLAAAAAVTFMVPVNPILVIAGCGLAGTWLLGDVGSDRRPPVASGARTEGRATLALVLGAAGGIALLFWLDRQLFDLAVTMVRIDLVAFGGGFASVPLMQHEVVEAREWMTARAFMDGIALGQVTPGPIVITATFAGYLVRGIAGAVVATLAVFLPSFVLVALISPHFDRLQRLVVFRGATRGALVSFVGLLASVTVRFAFATSWTIETAILALAAFGALRLRIDVLWVVLGGVLVSWLAAR